MLWVLIVLWGDVDWMFDVDGLVLVVDVVEFDCCICGGCVGELFDWELLCVLG